VDDVPLFLLSRAAGNMQKKFRKAKKAPAYFQIFPPTDYPNPKSSDPNA
jgi:hypothetical protein